MEPKPSAKSEETVASSAMLALAQRAGRRYPATARLLKTADYRRVYDRGTRRQFGWTAVFLLRRDGQASRVGIAVPRRFGKAVERNRIKRRLRSAIAECLPELPSGWDLVLHPRPQGNAVEYRELVATLKRIFTYCAKQSAG